MYQTSITGHSLFQATSFGYGEPIMTFGNTQNGETPVSLVNIALASCVMMCIQGYYASQEGNQQIPIQVDSQLENGQFTLVIYLGETTSATKQEKILAYVDQKCNVKALLREDLTFKMIFATLESVK
ncbi:OsmC family protein [Streptococcus suis]|nr:OsmC family protein [Streptococcus suis]